MNAVLMAKSVWKIVWALMKFFLTGMRRLVLSVLVLYWAEFVFYTVLNYCEGGIQFVVSWYAHVSGDIFEPWSWKRFAAQQVFALGLTLVLAYFEWWNPRQRRSRASPAD